MVKREVDGVEIDATGQHISEAPYWQNDGETVAASDDDHQEGSVTAENVPMPDEDLSCQFPGCTEPTERTYCSDCRNAVEGGDGDA